MTHEDARALYSEYVDGTLGDGERDEMQAFLAQNPDAAAELIGFERTLSVLHRLPPQEPSLDLWQEFAPKLAEWQAERRQHPWLRLKQGWMGLMSQLSAGMILWTHALASRTHARFERYLMHDSLPLEGRPSFRE